MNALVHLWNDTFDHILYIHYAMCVIPLTLLCVMLHWHCVCGAGNGVAVSVNDIIIKLVATTLKVSTVHRLFIQHASILEQYTNPSACMHMYICIYVYECEAIHTAYEDLNVLEQYTYIPGPLEAI